MLLQGVQCSGLGVIGINLDFGVFSCGGFGVLSFFIWSDLEVSFKVGEVLFYLYQFQVLYINWIIWNVFFFVRKFVNFFLCEIVVCNGFLGNVNVVGGVLGNDIGLFVNFLEVFIFQNIKYNIGLFLDFCKFKKLCVLEVLESYLFNVGLVCLGLVFNNMLQEV